ncbi:MAG: hypothetical protein WCO23_00310 [bacterium]
MSEYGPIDFNEDFIVARHGIKPTVEDLASEEFKGISENGVELARQQAHEWLGLLKNAPETSVLLLSPTSEQIRAKSSMRVMANEMKTIVSQDEELGISVITEEDFADPKLTYNEMIKTIISKLNEQPDKKFVISAPLFIRGFALGPDRWMDKKGKPTKYLIDVLARNNKNEQAGLEDWIKNEGHLGDLEGPNPTQVAEEHIDGIQKLANFAGKYVPERPLIIGAIGHSWNLDALAIYLANNRKVDMEGLSKVGGSMIKEMEPITLMSDQYGPKLKYGDRLEMLVEDYGK